MTTNLNAVNIAISINEYVNRVLVAGKELKNKIMTALNEYAPWLVAAVIGGMTLVITHPKNKAEADKARAEAEKLRFETIEIASKFWQELADEFRLEVRSLKIIVQDVKNENIHLREEVVHLREEITRLLKKQL